MVAKVYLYYEKLKAILNRKKENVFYQSVWNGKHKIKTRAVVVVLVFVNYIKVFCLSFLLCMCVKLY